MASTAPPIKGVVEGDASLQLLKVVGIHARQPKGSREQARRFRNKIGLTRVGPAHDNGKALERIMIEAELLDHGVKGAGVAPMAPKGVFDVESCAAKAFGHRRHLSRGHKKEDGGGIDEATD